MAKETTKHESNILVSAVRKLKQSRVIRSPRITEKATQIAEHNVYTFDVAVSATKNEIKEAVKVLYKVNPRRINVITIHKRNVVVRGKRGTENGGRKAMVYLNKGDKIEFI